MEEPTHPKNWLAAAHCGRCHTCGDPLRSHPDNIDWCPQCQAFREYASHRRHGPLKLDPCPDWTNIGVRVERVNVSTKEDRLAATIADNLAPYRSRLWRKAFAGALMGLLAHAHKVPCLPVRPKRQMWRRGWVAAWQSQQWWGRK